MQPFDRHRADVGGLEQSAANLTEQATQAIDTSRLTMYAFAPAVANWDGIAAPELRAAPRPVREQAYAISDSLAWASTALSYWAGQVTMFNARVDQIVSDMLNAKMLIFSATGADGEPAPLGQMLDAAQAVDNAARKQWHEAHDMFIVSGGRTAAGMFQDGPTPFNVAAASAIGLLPPGTVWNPLQKMWDAFRNNFLPPGDYGPLGPWPWWGGRTAFAGGAAAALLREKYGIRMWHGDLRRRALAIGGLGPGAWSMLDKAAKAAKAGGAAAGFLSSLSDRLKRGDSTHGAAAGAAAETATITGCATAGARMGVSAPIPHPIGRGLAGLGGGLAGGVACSPIGRAVGDVASDGAEGIVDTITSIPEDLANGLRPRF